MVKKSDEDEWIDKLIELEAKHGCLAGGPISDEVRVQVDHDLEEAQKQYDIEDRRLRRLEKRRELKPVNMLIKRGKTVVGQLKSTGEIISTRKRLIVLWGRIKDKPARMLSSRKTPDGWYAYTKYVKFGDKEFYAATRGALMARGYTLIKE